MKIKLKKKVAKKSVVKPGLREKKPGEVATVIKWSYSREFAKALGRGGSGSGRARRNDVKIWGQSVLDRTAATMTGEGEADEEKN